MSIGKIVHHGVNAFSLLFLIAVFFVWALPAQAARYSFSPAEKTVNRGEEVYLGVYVDAQDEVVNAFSGMVEFDNDAVEILSVGIAGSIVDIWATEPTISGDTVLFEGVVMDPGFKSSNGHLFTLRLQVNDYGTVEAFLKNGVVLAHDGNATPVTVSAGTALLTVAPVGTRIEQIEQEVACYRPEAPDVSVAWYEEGWFTDEYIFLSWPVYGDETGAAVVLDQDSETVPEIFSDATDNWTLDAPSGGQWYAHVALQNDCGSGDAAHIPIQIDHQAPVVDIATVTYIGTDLHDDGRWTGLTNIHVSAVDDASGIESYTLITATGEHEPFSYDETGAIWEGFYSDWLEDGDPVFVRIRDYAGNEMEKQLRPTPAQLDVSPFRYALQPGYIIIKKWLVLWIAVGVILLFALVSIFIDWRHSRGA